MRRRFPLRAVLTAAETAWLTRAPWPPRPRRTVPRRARASTWRASRSMPRTCSHRTLEGPTTTPPRRRPGRPVTGSGGPVPALPFSRPDPDHAAYWNTGDATQPSPLVLRPGNRRHPGPGAAKVITVVRRLCADTTGNRVADSCTTASRDSPGLRQADHTYNVAPDQTWDRGGGLRSPTRAASTDRKRGDRAEPRLGRGEPPTEASSSPTRCPRSRTADPRGAGGPAERVRPPTAPGQRGQHS